MSFSETFAVIGLVAAGLVALMVAVSEPPLEDLAECAGCAVEAPPSPCEGC
jgi:hypothetical protein